MKKISSSQSLLCTLVLIVLLAGCSTINRQGGTPPPGFTALFNGKDLTGWRGGDTFDHRKYLALSEEQRTEQDAKWTADMQSHWRAEGDELVNDGHGKYATTAKDYGDFELLIE